MRDKDLITAYSVLEEVISGSTWATEIEIQGLISLFLRSACVELSHLNL